MIPGALRWRVTLQTLSEARDGYGQELPTWTDAGTYWAEIVTLSGREAVNAQQIKAESTHRVRMRYVGTIAPNQQLTFKGRILKIVWVNNVDERNRELVLLCQEVVTPSGQ